MSRTKSPVIVPKTPERTVLVDDVCCEQIKLGRKTVEIQIGRIEDLKHLAGKYIKFISPKREAIVQIIKITSYASLSACFTTEGVPKIEPMMSLEELMLRYNDISEDLVRNAGGVVAFSFETR